MGALGIRLAGARDDRTRFLLRYTRKAQGAVLVEIRARRRVGREMSCLPFYSFLLPYPPLQLLFPLLQSAEGAVLVESS